MINIKKFFNFNRDVIKVGTPLSLVGFLAYINSVIDITISSYSSTDLVVATGLAALFISLIMSPLMAIISANQSLFAKKIKGTETSDDMKSVYACLFSAILLSTLIGIIFFTLFDFFILQIIKIIPMPNDNIKELIFHYFNFTKYSIIIVPITFAVKGILNGYRLTKITLKVGLIETLIRFLILLSLLSAIFIFDYNVDDIKIIIILAMAIILSEIFGLIVGLILMIKNDILKLNFTIKQFKHEFKHYLKNTYGFFTFNALQNLSGVSVSLLFSNILVNLEPKVYAIYRIMLTVLGFNKIVINGYQQSNAIFCAKKLKNKFLPYYLKDYISFTFILSFISSIICLLIFYFILVFEYIDFFIPLLILSVIYLIEPFTSTIYRVLLHCKLEKKISIISLFVMIFYALSIFLFGRNSVYILFSISILNSVVGFFINFYVFKKNIIFKQDVV